MELTTNIASIGDRRETISSRTPSNLKIKLDENVTKGAFVEILKEIGDHQLFSQFYDSQQIRLKTKGLQGQFLKMDVSKFQSLMKIKLNVHADWERWLTKLLEVSQDYAPVLPLWHFAYERLYSEHKIRPPPWVRAWAETKMTSDNMTKEELRIWKMVKARLDEDPAQDNVPGEQDEDSEAAAATAAARAESR